MFVLLFFSPLLTREFISIYFRIQVPVESLSAFKGEEIIWTTTTKKKTKASEKRKQEQYGRGRRGFFTVYQSTVQKSELTKKSKKSSDYFVSMKNANVQSIGLEREDT